MQHQIIFTFKYKQNTPFLLCFYSQEFFVSQKESTLNESYEVIKYKIIETLIKIRCAINSVLLLKIKNKF